MHASAKDLGAQGRSPAACHGAAWRAFGAFQLTCALSISLERRPRPGLGLTKASASASVSPSTWTLSRRVECSNSNAKRLRTHSRIEIIECPCALIVDQRVPRPDQASLLITSKDMPNRAASLNASEYAYQPSQALRCDKYANKLVYFDMSLHSIPARADTESSYSLGPIKIAALESRSLSCGCC